MGKGGGGNGVTTVNGGVVMGGGGNGGKTVNGEAVMGGRL